MGSRAWPRGRLRQREYARTCGASRHPPGDAPATPEVSAAGDVPPSRRPRRSPLAGRRSARPAVRDARDAGAGHSRSPTRRSAPCPTAGWPRFRDARWWPPTRNSSTGPRGCPARAGLPRTSAATSRSLSPAITTRAFSLYQAARITRTARVQLVAHEMGRNYHAAGVMRLVRRSALGAGGSAIAAISPVQGTIWAWTTRGSFAR